MKIEKGFSLTELLVVVAIALVLLGVFATTKVSQPGANRRSSAKMVKSGLSLARMKAVTLRKPIAFVWDGEGVLSGEFKGRGFAVFSLDEAEGGYEAEKQISRWQSLSRGAVFFTETLRGEEVTIQYDKKEMKLQALIFNSRGRIVAPDLTNATMDLVSGAWVNGRLQVTEFQESGHPAQTELTLSALTGLVYEERF